MARGLAETPPTDAAGKAAAMEKALGYAERVKNGTKPAKMDDADWQGVQSRLHGILGTIYFNQSKWADANREYTEFLKTNPKDGMVQFRNGVSLYTQLQQTLTNLQALNTEAQKAQKAGEDVEAYVTQLNLRNKEFEALRDQTIDAMAKALAIGGPFASSAQQVIDPLFLQKTGSKDGLTAYIATKKAELDALTPLPTPVVGGARGTSAAGAGANGPAGTPPAGR